MPTTTREPEQARLYDILNEQHRLADDSGLPTQATLAEIESALGGLTEFLIEPTTAAVLKVAEKGEPGSISYADIGRLVVWADDMHDRAQEIIAMVAKVHVAAREAGDIAAGYRGSSPVFDRHGGVADQQAYGSVTRRFRDA